MKKAELSRLRTLNVTKSMIDALGIKSDKYNPYGKKYEWKYDVAARCQQLGGFLKISICKREDVFDQIVAPRWDIFIDYSGYQYITRERRDDGTYRWRECMADNLEAGYYWYERKTEKYCYINQEGSRAIKSILGTEASGLDGIVEWQRACKKKKADQLYENHKKQWAKELAGVKEPPKGFVAWWHKEAFRKNFIFYNLQEDRHKGMCTYCQEIVEFKDKRVVLSGKMHNMEGICPKCKKKIEFISRGLKKQPVDSHSETVGLLQKFKDGLIYREFNVRRIDYADRQNINQSKFNIWEFRRTIINDSLQKVYIYDDYKNRGMCWMKDQEQSIDKFFIKTYPRNLAMLLKNYHTSYLIAQKYGYRAAGLKYFLVTERKHPIIEQLYKAGLCRLAGSMVNYPSTVGNIYINYTAGDLAKKLGIDNARMKRLKEMDGNEDTLYWLRKEKRENTQYRDEDIKIMTMLGIDEYEFKRNKVFKYLSISKICNYLDKQQKARGGTRGVNINSIWRNWNDYIDMMAKANMDITKEILLKPKDLVLAHNELVARLSKDNNKAEIKARKKKYKAAEELMNSGELKKYEYEDDKYQIIAPGSIDDIYHEGIVLKHCIHTCEIYFGRINIKESYLMFLRRKSSPSVPWYTLEIEPGGEYKAKKICAERGL